MSQKSFSVKPQNLYSNPNVPKPYKEIAKGMEKQFARHMIEQMENSVQKSKPLGAGEKYYNSMLADERADIMAEVENGIGLKELILEQIVPDNIKNRRESQFDKIEMYKKQGEE